MTDETEDFRAPRLFVEHDLHDSADLPLSREQANYLLNVLRLGDRDSILIFNGRDGEWRAHIQRNGKRDAALGVDRKTRAQTPAQDLHYLFAPLKRSRLDYMVQKATELGVSRLAPVITRRTVAERVNLDRMRANAIEAAEQCGILTIPEVVDPQPLKRTLESWPTTRALIFCDEDAPIADPVEALRQVPVGPLSLLIGPEGGFDPEERSALLHMPNVHRLALGPRIMRADTAAVAALALVNAVLGDWRGQPNKISLA